MPSGSRLARIRHRTGVSDSLIANHRAARVGHAVDTDRQTGDVPLELHIPRPTAGDTTGVRPAVLWFHGGSGQSGNWSHSPGIVRELGRLGLVGFSSGAGLARWLGTRDHSAHALDTDVAATARRYPAAVIISGVCVDPAGPTEDGYFRKRVSAHAPVRLCSPIELIAAGQPRTLMIHAANDECCDFADAERFSVMSGAVGNDVRCVPLPNATHFFGFYDRPGQAIMRTAIEDALAAWGWRQRP